VPLGGVPKATHRFEGRWPVMSRCEGDTDRLLKGYAHGQAALPQANAQVHHCQNREIRRPSSALRIDCLKRATATIAQASGSRQLLATSNLLPVHLCAAHDHVEQVPPLSKQQSMSPSVAWTRVLLTRYSVHGTCGNTWCTIPKTKVQTMLHRPSCPNQLP
jgi:hypothetical protein